MPIRFAGTCSEYSGSAMSQLSSTADPIDKYCQRRCPYQATVITDVESISSTMVHIVCNLLLSPATAVGGLRIDYCCGVTTIFDWAFTWPTMSTRRRMP